MTGVLKPGSRLRSLATAMLLSTAAMAATHCEATDGNTAQANGKHTPAVSHFAWGVEAGAAVDLTSNDLSNATIAAHAGYRNSWIDVLGVGLQVSTMVSESHRSFPVYVLFRSNFRQRPSVCFLNLKIGAAINDLGQNDKQTGFYASPALGFNLARGKTFQSYLLVGYEFNGLRPFNSGSSRVDIHGLHMGTVGLGITF